MKMKKTLISNPPYNMKWEIPPFAQIQPRFSKCYVVPPANNANYAFVLTGLEKHDRCVFLLPAAIMSSNQKEEKAIREWLVEEKLVEAVIICPDNMFESTGVGTCIIVLDKNKEHVTTEMIDIRNRYVEEIRDQKGQYGGTSHTNRIYQKKIKVIPEKIMEDVLDAIRERKSIPDFCKSVSIEKIKEDKYSLLASHYLDIQEEEVKHRSYEDIVEDLNRVVREKNACKLTINESLAKGMGFDIEMYKNDQQDTGLNEMLVKLGAPQLEKDNYFSTSKNKNEIRFENNSKDILSSILVMIMQTWKQHIYYLNQQENRYLAELRDALIPDLMSGKIDVT